MKLLFDMTLMRPGCINLCAAFGGDREATLAFMAETWLTAPTPDMQLYEISKAQLADVVPKVETLCRKTRSTSL